MQVKSWAGHAAGFGMTGDDTQKAQFGVHFESGNDINKTLTAILGITNDFSSHKSSIIYTVTNLSTHISSVYITMPTAHPQPVH